MRRRAISALAAALALVLTLVTPALAAGRPNWEDRKSTRLNSSHRN